MKYGCVPAVVSRAEEVPDLVDERLLVVLGHPGSRKLEILIKIVINIFYYIKLIYLSGVPRRVDTVDFAADAVLVEGAGQEDGQVGGLKEGLLVVS